MGGRRRWYGSQLIRQRLRTIGTPMSIECWCVLPRRFIPGQRRLLCHRGADLQSVSRLSLPCPWKRMGAFASADRALAVVSDGGQDCAPWPADVLEGRRRHVGPVSYTHLRAHETRHELVCRLLLEKKKNKKAGE